MFNSKEHHKGKYIPINKDKYIGDINNINFRSSWERCVCKYLDLNPDIEYWSVEQTVIKYRCATDNGIHDYYIDFTIKYKSGKVLLIEVKPYSQTQLPKATSGKSKRTYINQVLAFTKNKSKWVEAVKFAKANNCEFKIWTEKTLKLLGVPII